MSALRQILLFSTLIFLDSGFFILAQNDLKYKDIFSTLQTAKKEEIYPLLLTYQGKDPHFANVYYQLGLINEEWARGYDPLTEHPQVSQFIYNTNLFFGLAKYYLDEKQARRNSQYFNKVKPAPGKSDPGFKEIQEDLESHLKNIQIYKTHADQAYEYFTQTTSYYNKCVELFLNICGNQNMLKEIYLTANDSFLRQTDHLLLDFDSTILYFDKLKLGLDSFPLKNYKQRYQLKSIETYRLDGLTGSDFTNDTVQLWNYKAWVLNLNRILTTEIKDLRNHIDSANLKLDKAISLFQNKPDWNASGFHFPEIDPLLKNRLVKIDFGSVALKLINYKESLIKLIVLSRDSLNVSTDSLKQIPILKKSWYYQDLVYKKELVDSLLQDFEHSTTKSNIKKYEKFFEQNFTGNDAFIKYTSAQKKFISITLDKALENFKNYLLFEPSKVSAESNLYWKKAAIPVKGIQAGQGDQILTDHYLTYVSKTDNTGNLFLAGSFIQAGKKPVAFIAYAEKAKTVNWLKTYDFSINNQPSYNYALNLEVNGSGCYVVVSSILPGIDSVSVDNTILRLDLKGNELMRQKSHPGSIIRWLLFDDINNKIFAAFQGKKIGLADTGPGELYFSSMDSTGIPQWNYSTSISGELADIVRMGENWLIFCNVSGFTSGAKWIAVKDDKDQPSKGIISILLNGSGEYLQTNQYKQCIPAEIEKLVKLNSETLNVLALRKKEKPNPTSAPDNTGRLVYLLVDKKGNPFYLYY